MIRSLSLEMSLGVTEGTSRTSPLLYGALLAGIVGGVLTPIYFFLVGDVTPLAWDFLAYLNAADAFAAGERFVGLQASVGNGVYVYPPIVVLLFVPYVLLSGWLVPFLLQFAVNLALGAILGVLIVRVIEQRLSRELPTLDRGLILAFCLASTYPMISLGQGQVDHAVAIALVLGFLYMERGGEVKGGVAFAFAAIVKLFPVLIGVWLLYRRAWKAIAAAVVTGCSALVVSLLVFGVDLHVRYLRFILSERSRVSRFDGSFATDFFGMTLSRPLSVLFPQVDPRFYTLIAAALFVPILLILYRRASTFRGRLVSFLGTLIAILVVSPASNLNHILYLYFPMVTLAYTLDHRPSRRLLLVGIFVLSFPFHLPQVSSMVDLVGLSPGLEQGVMSVVVPVLTLATVTLYGLMFVVAGCLAYALRATGARGQPHRLEEGAD